MRSGSLLLALLLPLVPLSSETLRYAVFPAPPFIIIEESSGSPSVSGLDVVLAQEICRRTGDKLEFIQAPWVRCLELMKSGQVDLLSSAFKTAERESYMEYLSLPYLERLPVSFYYLKNSGIQIRNYEDLQKVGTIGKLRGANYFQRFDEDTTLKKYDLREQSVLYQMLVNRRIEVFIGYEATEDYFLERNGYRSLIEKSEFKHAEAAEVYFTLSRSSSEPERIRRWNKAFGEMIREGWVRGKVESFLSSFSPRVRSPGSFPGSQS